MPATHLRCLLQGLHSLSHAFFSAWSPTTNSAMCSPATTISPLSYTDGCASGAQYSPCPAPHCKRSNTAPCLKCCAVCLSSHLIASPFYLPSICCPIYRQELWQFICIPLGFIVCDSSGGCYGRSPKRRGFFSPTDCVSLTHE